MKLREEIARKLCELDGGNPGHSLGGDKQNWLWHEYLIQADAVIFIIRERGGRL